jgi:hypothetical protein
MPAFTLSNIPVEHEVDPTAPLNRDRFAPLTFATREEAEAEAVRLVRAADPKIELRVRVGERGDGTFGLFQTYRQLHGRW